MPRPRFDGVCPQAVFVAIALVGCSSSDPPLASTAPEFVEPTCASPSEVCLAAPAEGFQIRSEGTQIQPGEDVEYCEVVLLPGAPEDTYYVRAFETQMSAGSHHLIVAAVDPGSATDLHAVPGDRVPCTGPDVYGGQLGPVTGAQLPYGHEAFPEGVGRVYHGGQKVIFDYHYFNATAEPIAARAAVNFHTTSADRIKKLSRVFGFYNLGIVIAPGEEASFREECAFSHDVFVHKLTRHTHKWGTRFDVWRSGGAQDGELLFSSPDYETVDFPFDEPVLVRAGEGFRFECTFVNTESYTLEFGVKASDEMCILFGSWYPAGDGEVPGQSCFTL
jgi:hypothetical protein